MSRTRARHRHQRSGTLSKGGSSHPSRQTSPRRAEGVAAARTWERVEQEGIPAAPGSACCGWRRASRLNAPVEPSGFQLMVRSAPFVSLKSEGSIIRSRKSSMALTTMKLSGSPKSSAACRRRSWSSPGNLIAVVVRPFFEVAACAVAMNYNLVITAMVVKHRARGSRADRARKLVAHVGVAACEQVGIHQFQPGDRYPAVWWRMVRCRTTRAQVELVGLGSVGTRS